MYVAGSGLVSVSTPGLEQSLSTVEKIRHNMGALLCTDAPGKL